MSTRIDLATELTEEELLKKAHELLESGKSLREFENIPSEGLEAVYFLAYHAYQAGNFGKADCLFKFLCYLDHQEKKYWLGLGANRQMQKDFAGAVEAYSMAGLLDLGDPRPPM